MPDLKCLCSCFFFFLEAGEGGNKSRGCCAALLGAELVFQGADGSDGEKHEHVASLE